MSFEVPKETIIEQLAKLFDADPKQQVVIGNLGPPWDTGYLLLDREPCQLELAAIRAVVGHGGILVNKNTEENALYQWTARFNPEFPEFDHQRKASESDDEFRARAKRLGFVDAKTAEKTLLEQLEHAGATLDRPSVAEAIDQGLVVGIEKESPWVKSDESNIQFVEDADDKIAKPEPEPGWWWCRYIGGGQKGAWTVIHVAQGSNGLINESGEELAAEDFEWGALIQEPEGDAPFALSGGADNMRRYEGGITISQPDDHVWGDKVPAEKRGPAPPDWHSWHSKACGTQYRGCAPDCPSAVYEHTGKWPLSEFMDKLADGAAEFYERGDPLFNAIKAVHDNRILLERVVFPVEVHRKNADQVSGLGRLVTTLFVQSGRAEPFQVDVGDDDVDDVFSLFLGGNPKNLRLRLVLEKEPPF